MFGQGSHDASNIYLAIIPKSEFASGVDSSGNGATRYFTGLSQGKPTWSASESAAVPVVTDIDPANPTIGNSSAFYSQQLGLWLMTFDGGRGSLSTKGVYFTYAPLMESDFTIAGCQYSLSSGGQVFLPSGGPGSVTITTSPGCPWEVSGLPSWVVLTGAPSGTGSGTVTFQVLTANNTDLSALFTIAGETFAIEQVGPVPGLSFTGSMPHLAAEGGWNTTFTLVNKGAAAAIARTNLFAPSGAPLTLPVNLPQ
jgi:hypothetical protein